MADGDRKSPLPAYYFEVEINGEVHPFRSCSGLKVEAAVVEVEEGGFNSTVRKLPGRTKFPNLVLKQGFCGAGSPLYAMRRLFINDNPADTVDSSGALTWRGPNRFSGTITQKGPNGAECKWMFLNAWVCKWEGPDLDATKNECSIETIEIAHEGLYMLPGAGGGGGSSGGAP